MSENTGPVTKILSNMITKAVRLCNRSARIFRSWYFTAMCVLCVVLLYVCSMRRDNKAVSWDTILINQNHPMSAGIDESKQEETVTTNITFALDNKQTISPVDVKLAEYKSVLDRHASKDKVIVLALVDVSYMDMTLNFYETSILKFGITNYLFMANDKDACDMLFARGANCYVYMTTKDPKKVTVYGTRDFNQKMNIRTFMLLDALNLGFTVLHTDVDIVFMKNPLVDLQSTDDGVHVAVLWDSMANNAGFIYLKPSNLSIRIYTEMKHLALTTPLDDQRALNRAIDTTTKNKPQQRKMIQSLDVEKYQCGKKYFEQGGRYFTGKPCQQCIVVHNNWMVSKEAKRYRFQETGLWSVDDQGYYSNKSTRYIIYTNPTIAASSSVLDHSVVELKALKAALYIGHVLHRQVILPRFNLIVNQKNKKRSGADIQQRPLNCWVKMSKFDWEFHHEYRESTFLEHLLVPENIKRNTTKQYWAETKIGRELLGTVPPSVVILTPSSGSSVSTSDLRRWFGAEKAAVISLYSTYGIFGTEDTPHESDTKAFNVRLEKAFVKSNYRQQG